MELFAAIGWLLRIYVGVFGPLGLLALIVATLVAASPPRRSPRRGAPARGPKPQSSSLMLALTR